MRSILLRVASAHLFVGLLLGCQTTSDPGVPVAGSDYLFMKNGVLQDEFRLPNRQRITPVFPPGAAPIHSDYASSTDVSGLMRGHNGIHNGLDLGSFRQDVIAMADGIITYAGPWKDWGNSLTIRHGRDDDGLFLYTQYDHLHTIEAFKYGDRVKRGQKVGTVGATGKAAGPIPHLHMMVFKRTDKSENGVATVNPHRFWINGVGMITCFDPTAEYPDTRPRRFTYPIPCNATGKLQPVVSENR